MKLSIHRELAERIREGCEGRLNIRIHPRWFAFGSIYPDCTHQRILHLHEMPSAAPLVGRMIRRFCGKSIYSGQSLSRWRSLRLGIVMHYVTDFQCFVHTPAFNGTLLEHRAYEVEQGQLSDEPIVRDLISFYGVESSGELFDKLCRAIETRDEDSFSPQNDIDAAYRHGRHGASAAALPFTVHRSALDSRSFAERNMNGKF